MGEDQIQDFGYEGDDSVDTLGYEGDDWVLDRGSDGFPREMVPIELPPGVEPSEIQEYIRYLDFPFPKVREEKYEAPREDTPTLVEFGMTKFEFEKVLEVFLQEKVRRQERRKYYKAQSKYGERVTDIGKAKEGFVKAFGPTNWITPNVCGVCGMRASYSCFKDYHFCYHCSKGYQVINGIHYPIK